MTLYLAPDEPFKTTLDGSASSTDTTIALVSTTGLQAPGVVVIDRQDGLGTDTFGNMEFCSFTGISGRSLTGVTRGLGGTAAKKHNSGALVESFLDITHWSNLVDYIQVEHETTGLVNVLKHLRQISVTGVSGTTVRGDLILSAQGSVTIYPISGSSGYPRLVINTGGGGGGFFPFQILGGVASLTGATPAMIIEDSTNLKSISALLLYPASGASLVIDVNKNFTSLFTDQSTRLAIPGGGTYASTASIGTLAVASGDIMTMDVDTVGDAFDLTVLLET